MPDLPTIMTESGLAPTPPATWLAELLAIVAAEEPGYTALPGSLIEDISSTDVAAIVVMDQIRIELVNSLTPFAANEFLLNQLGNIYGITRGGPANTFVFVVFAGTPGFVISVGFRISDGTHQYTVQDGGIIGTSGFSNALFCLAVNQGSWAVPADSVTTIVTSVPSTITLTCNNPETGTPGQSEESLDSYRSRILQAGLAASQGMARYLKTLLSEVPGVQPRLIAVQQQTPSGWIVICGGGDPLQVAYAIYTALFDISTLVGSTLTAVNITQANPAVVETNINNQYMTGQAVTISGSNPSTYNGSYVATVIDATHFSIGIDTTAYAPYVADSATVSPSLTTVTASILDYPDTYAVRYVNPPQQTVAIAVTWNTTATNFVSPVAIAAAAQPALAAYINGIQVGQPINLFELQATFQAAVAAILPPQLLTRMVFAVSIDGIGISPEVGTGVIAGDPQSYLLTNISLITVVQG